MAQQSFLDSIAGIAGGGGEEASSIVNILFDNRKSRLKMISEVTPDLIYALSLLSLIADKYKSSVLSKFLSELLQFQISRDRKGRGELIEAVLAGRSHDSDMS